MSFLHRVLGLCEHTDNQIIEQFNRQMEEHPEEEEGVIVEQEQKKEETKEGARIMFSVTNAGDVSLQMQWTSKSEEVAEALGALLFFINSGKLGQQCEHVLNATIHQDPSSRSFIKKVADAWKERLKKNEPVVRPSEVFQMGRQNVEHRILPSNN